MGIKTKLPMGIEDFKEMRVQGFYYIDKTGLIKELLEHFGKVNLFTRPRRFGKTLNLSMLRYFFEDTGNTEKNEQNKELFRGMKIMDEGETYTRQMGKYPVINLTLKSAKQEDFETAYYMIQAELASEFERHREIIEHGKQSLAVKEYEQYISIADEKADQKLVRGSIKLFSQCMRKITGNNTVVLIDEYDVPLENAYFAGFYGEMTSFIRSLFDSALKTNLSLEFAVVTGCLRITRESIFTGLNNLNMISVLSDLYAEYFGFTQKEVDEALRFYGREGKREVMKRWYDGYRFGSAEVYNPWSVIKYIQDIAENENYLPRPYWANTSSNNIVKTLVEKADISVKEEIEKLIGGGAVEKAVHEEVTYGDMDGNQDNLWNFLFFTGYLKKVEERIEGRTIRLKLAIPNEEVRYIYENTIINWFRERIKKEDLSLLYRSLEEGDCQAAGEIIASHLAGTISFYDYAENFYHGFMLGMLSQADRYIVRSNRESGNGRYDIVMKTPSRRGLAILIELKAALSMDDLEKACQRGLSQIEEMGYGRELQEDGYRNIKRYAVAFYKKDCEVMGG